MSNLPILSQKMIKVLKRYEQRLEQKFLSMDEMKKAYRVRYKSFFEELGWIPENKMKLDFDKYDEEAVHLGVYAGGDLISYCRVIDSPQNFMIDKEFNNIVDGSDIEERSAEVSRLVTSEKAKKFEKFAAPLLMYREVYKYMIKNKLRYCYIVVTQQYLKTVQKIFPFKRIGSSESHPGESLTVAAVLDLRQMEDYFKNDKNFYSWFTQSQT